MSLRSLSIFTVIALYTGRKKIVKSLPSCHSFFTHISCFILFRNKFQNTRIPLAAVSHISWPLYCQQYNSMAAIVFQWLGSLFFSPLDPISKHKVLKNSLFFVDNLENLSNIGIREEYLWWRRLCWFFIITSLIFRDDVCSSYIDYSHRYLRCMYAWFINHFRRYLR